MSNNDFGLINKWLRHIKDIYRIYTIELDKIDNITERHARLVELNIFEQIHNLAKTTIVQRAWHEKRTLTLHGWVYQLHNGMLKPLTTMDGGSRIEDIYMYNFGVTR